MLADDVSKKGVEITTAMWLDDGDVVVVTDGNDPRGNTSGEGGEHASLLGASNEDGEASALQLMEQNRDAMRKNGRAIAVRAM